METKVAEDIISSSNSHKFKDFAFIENTPGDKKLLVLYENAPLVGIYIWDGSLFPGPKFIEDIDLDPSLQNGDGSNFNTRIVPVLNGKALVQNDDELILVDVSKDIAEQSNYTVTHEGVGIALVTHFDFAVDRVYFVNSSGPTKLFSQLLNGSSPFLQAMETSYQEDICHGLRVTSTGFIYAIFEQSSPLKNILAVFKTGSTNHEKLKDLRIQES